jgi:hypothetical protein
MLIEMYRRGWRPDAIVMANVGSEKVGTYKFLPVFDAWLRAVKFPPITMVKYVPKIAPYRTIEGNCIVNATLPGVAFNLGSCAMKWKIEPQNRWSRSWEPAKKAWAAGQKLLKLIGFESDEGHRLKRADAKAHSGKLNKLEASRYEYQMPLMDWGINLEKCLQIIDDAGLPIPPKSACFFCPNQKPHELADVTDEDRARIILMEVSAEPYNVKMRGLWRKKSMTEHILEQGLPFTPLQEIAEAIVLNPKCQKAANGVTFQPPHVGPTLRELLAKAGHKVPAVLLSDDGREGIRYRESVRLAPLESEHAAHDDIIENAA